jgi:hypothetical protein
MGQLASFWAILTPFSLAEEGEKSGREARGGRGAGAGAAEAAARREPAGSHSARFAGPGPPPGAVKRPSRFA